MSVELFANAATTTLNGSINNSVTSLTVVDASTFPATGNFRIVIDTEIMEVTAVSGNTLTVVRGTENTTASSHTSGSTVTVILTAAALAAFRSNNIGFDTVANRPSAGYAGRLYIPKDGSGSLAIDDGTNWNPFGLYNFALTAPSTGTFGTTFGTATDSFTQNGDAIVHQITSTSGTRTVARLKTLTQGKVYTAQLSPFMTPTATGNAFAGMVIRDSSTGNARIFGFSFNITGTNARLFGVLSETGTTNFGTPGNVNTIGNSAFPSTPLFLRINQPASGNRLFQWSIDNSNWITFLSEAWNLTVANPNQFGFALYSDSTNAGALGQIIRHFTEV